MGWGRGDWDVLEGRFGLFFPWRDAVAATWRLSFVQHFRLTCCRTDWRQSGLRVGLGC